MLKRKQPLLRHTVHIGEDYTLLPPNPPDNENLPAPSISGEFGTIFYYIIWALVAMVVVALGIAGTIVSNTQLQRNEIQTLEIYILRENVTYLDFLNLFDTFGLTQLIQRFYPSIPGNLTDLENNATYFEGQVLILENLYQIIFADLWAIYYEILNLFTFQGIVYNHSLLLNQTLANISNTTLPSVYNTVVFYNTSFLYTINGIGSIPPDKNVNLSGVGGLDIYPSLTQNATLILDGCSLQNQINVIDANFTAAVEQFIKDTVMSNITVDTINGQSPVNGNIDLIAGDAYTSITTAVPTEVLVTLNGMETINGISPNATVDGANFRIHADGSPWIVVNQTGPQEITIGSPTVATFLHRIDGAFDVVSTNTTATTVTLTNPLTQAEYDDNNNRISCEATRNYPYTGPPATQWAPGIYYDLTPESFVSTNSAAVRPCRYMPGAGSGNAYIDLYEANATFLITLTLISTDYWMSLGSRGGVGFRIELLWCIVPSGSDLCRKTTVGYSTALIDTTGPQNPCYGGTGTNNPSGLEYCWVTFSATVMYTTPPVVAPRRLKFTAFNGGFGPSPTYDLYVYGFKSIVKVVRVL